MYCTAGTGSCNPFTLECCPCWVIITKPSVLQSGGLKVEVDVCFTRCQSKASCGGSLHVFLLSMDRSAALILYEEVQK